MSDPHPCHPPSAAAALHVGRPELSHLRITMRGRPSGPPLPAESSRPGCPRSADRSRTHCCVSFDQRLGWSGGYFFGIFSSPCSLFSHLELRHSPAGPESGSRVLTSSLPSTSAFSPVLGETSSSSNVAGNGPALAVVCFIPKCSSSCLFPDLVS